MAYSQETRTYVTLAYLSDSPKKEEILTKYSKELELGWSFAVLVSFVVGVLLGRNTRTQKSTHRCSVGGSFFHQPVPATMGLLTWSSCNHPYPIYKLQKSCLHKQTCWELWLGWIHHQPVLFISFCWLTASLLVSLRVPGLYLACLRFSLWLNLKVALLESSPNYLESWKSYNISFILNWYK